MIHIKAPKGRASDYRVEHGKHGAEVMGAVNTTGPADEREKDLLTPELVENVIGPTDEDLKAELILTGATSADLLEAVAWLEADQATGRQTRRMPHGMVARLCQILAARQPEEDRDR